MLWYMYVKFYNFYNIYYKIIMVNRKSFKKVSYVISKLSNLSAQSIAQYMVENKITISLSDSRMALFI